MLRVRSQGKSRASVPHAPRGRGAHVLSSHDTIALYERHAQAFDQDRGKALFERGWLDKFRALAGEGRAILDIGCGSGEPIGQYLIAAGHPLTGVDSSARMIGMCRARFPDHDWVVADMRALALPFRFGGLVAWDSFFHLTHDQQRAMFAVFRAHAEPGAALMFTSGDAHWEAIGSYRGEALYHASLAPGEYRALLAAHGFRVVDHVANDPACGWHTVWLAQAV